MFIIYDLFFLIFAIVYLPIYLFKGKFHQGFLNRLGFLPAVHDLNQPIWIHAVSVGEVLVVRSLFEQLKNIYPNKKFVVSTVTPTGNSIARKFVGQGDLLIYLPLDFSFIISGVIRKIDPALVIIAETELWPNFISSLNKNKIPLVIVNGRISDNSFSGYQKIKFLIRPILNKISLFCVQSQTDALRLKVLGVDSDKVKISGNMKFDIRPPARSAQDYAIYRQKLLLGADDMLLVCGSTHPGEEDALISIYKKLLKDFPKLKILFAPRHPQRSQEIGRLILASGFRPLFVSCGIKECTSCCSRPVFVLDQIGHLFDFYNAADIVFVGGSLVKKGGHNILEPASLKKPVVFGPQMFNFRDIANLFVENKAALKALDAFDLEVKIRLLLQDKDLARQMGKRAFDLLEQSSGATARNLELIKNFIRS
jgi:3-deoxy-D-manno-octulosonic-acid transferase